MRPKCITCAFYSSSGAKVPCSVCFTSATKPWYCPYLPLLPEHAESEAACTDCQFAKRSGMSEPCRSCYAGSEFVSWNVKRNHEEEKEAIKCQLKQIIVVLEIT